MKLVLAMMVRNELERLRVNIPYHLRKGVDHLIVIDDRSTDGSGDFARSFKEVTVWRSEAYDQQTQNTKAGLYAREKLGADWVLFTDADEFWTAKTSLKEEIGRRDVDLVRCGRKHFLPRGREKLWEESWRFYHCPVKVENPLRQEPNAPRGPLAVGTWGRRSLFLYGAHRKSAVRTKKMVSVASGGVGGRFVGEATECESVDLEIWHFPVRKREDFIARLEVASGGGPAWQWWRKKKEQGRDAMVEEWRRLVPLESEISRYLEQGVCVETDQVEKELLGL